MFSVQCPVTGEQTFWPDCKADMVPSLLELSEQFEIAIEDLFVMVKITAELGEEWFEDSLEFNDCLMWASNDNTLLKMAKCGECELSIMELLAIRDRARAGLELLLKHERDPKKRTKLQRWLRESEVSKANRALAREMLEKQKAN